VRQPAGHAACFRDSPAAVRDRVVLIRIARGAGRLEVAELQAEAQAVGDPVVVADPVRAARPEAVLPDRALAAE
jgi:hypothetical protein